MKVGTDGVLLGAWTNIDNAKTVLDIGTGTGLITLMLAQRLNNKSLIDAIDIDKSAAEQATDNIVNSGFKGICCMWVALQEYADCCQKNYDLIVSNPPYFSDSLHSPDQQRTLARHTPSLTSTDFVKHAVRLLSDVGKLSVIFPYGDHRKMIDVACNEGLTVTRMTTVYTTPNSSAKRILIEFSKETNQLIINELIIETERHIYSEDFTTLLKDFYLKM
jgi:tRNA1Val (adenine37-N6)-methyltransferase